MKIYFTKTQMFFLNISDNSDSTHSEKVLMDIINYSYYPAQFFLFLYLVSSCIWLYYAIRKIYFHLKEKRVLEGKRSSGALLYAIELDNKISSAKLKLLRYWIFAIFVSVEITFGLNVNLYGIFNIQLTPVSINLGHNCTLQPDTYLTQWYILDPGYVVVNLFCVFSNFSSSLMVWLFGASLLNLSHAALEHIYVSKIIKYILLGFSINLIIAIGTIVPHTSLIFKITESIMDQISLFIVLYIVRKKFFPAMYSRARFALQNSSSVGRSQIRLLKLYKYVIAFVMITFEIRILKDLIFYNGFIVFESISTNPCWFTVTYHFPVFQLPAPTINVLVYISISFLVIVRFIDMIIYFNFIVMNSTINCISSWPILKQQFTKRNVAYRYRIGSRVPRQNAQASN